MEPMRRARTASRCRATSSLVPATWWASSMITMSQPASTRARNRRGVVRIDLFGTPASTSAKRLDRIDRAHHLVEGRATGRRRCRRANPPARPGRTPRRSDRTSRRPTGAARLSGRRRRPVGPASAGLHLGEDGASGDRLAKSDLVADRKPHRIHRKRTIERGELVREERHSTSCGDQRLTVSRQCQRPSCRRPPDHLCGRPRPSDQVGEVTGRRHAPAAGSKARRPPPSPFPTARIGRAPRRVRRSPATTPTPSTCVIPARPVVRRCGSSAGGRSPR